MKHREVVILAGGFGTRLAKAAGELPKSMVPVNGKPFLVYILDQLCRYRVNRAILAVGYRHEEIESFFGSKYRNLELVYSVEKEPLGTGGAILKAAGSVTADSFLTINGDTFFDIDLEDFRKKFIYSNASLSVALKPMRNFDRYGSVTIEEGRITQFSEKKHCEEGLINGGIYILRREWLISDAPSEKFSFEKHMMERLVTKDLITGYISDNYFIDIGIPEDYQRAQNELK